VKAMNEYYIAVFDSTHYALKFEKVIKENGFKITIMPVPREITASCGISAKLEIDEIEKIMSLAVKEDLKVQGFYHVESENGKKTYHKST
jgi:D-alanine-D-alanine ligase-like ATP-grasp enzyme